MAPGLIILIIMVIAYRAYRAYVMSKHDAPAPKSLPRVALESNLPRAGTRLGGTSPLMTTWTGSLQTGPYYFPQGQYRLSLTLYEPGQTEVFLLDAATGNRRTLLMTSATANAIFAIEPGGEYMLGVSPSTRGASWTFTLYVPTESPPQ